MVYGDNGGRDNSTSATGKMALVDWNRSSAPVELAIGLGEEFGKLVGAYETLVSSRPGTDLDFIPAAKPTTFGL